MLGLLLTGSLAAGKPKELSPGIVALPWYLQPSTIKPKYLRSHRGRTGTGKMRRSAIQPTPNGLTRRYFRNQDRSPSGTLHARSRTSARRVTTISTCHSLRTFDSEMERGTTRNSVQSSSTHSTTHCGEGLT